MIKLAPDDTRHTGTIVLPLNVDVTDRTEKVIVPLQLIKESLKKIDYIAGMDSCLCREANDCKDYPHDLGCLFLGNAAKAVVKHRLGRQFTYEEACARVDRAAEAGLMGQAVWIEVEQMLWGVRNDLMDHFLELCVGCGICRSRCPMDAISLKQTMPMRADLQEYFLKDYNLDLKL